MMLDSQSDLSHTFDSRVAIDNYLIWAITHKLSYRWHI